MSQLQDLLDREARRIDADPDALDSVLRVRDRRLRRRRIGAAAFALFIFGAGVAWFAREIGAEGSLPANEPSLAPPPASAGPFKYVDLRTGTTTPMPENIADSWSLLSPDGRMFVYTRHNSIFVANVDGSNERRVTPEGVRAVPGGWSPDGSTIAYQRDSHGLKPGNLFTVDLATGETTQLTDLEQVNAWHGITYMAASFSPDGQTILFHRPRLTGGVFDLWSVPVTGGEPTIVRRNAAFGLYSPDGQSVAFLSPTDDNNDLRGRLWIADAAGGPARELLDGNYVGWARWSPDGTMIAYEGNGIQVADVATGETSGVVSCGGPVEWFDVDTLIVGPGGC